MIVLDTNVISEPGKPQPNARVMNWLNSQRLEWLFLTSVSVAELLEGVEVLPEGKRKLALKASVRELLEKLIVTPILSFDQEAAEVYATTKAQARLNRYSLPIMDTQIAAIAKVHGFKVATRDVDPFMAAGVSVINPWEA